MNVDWDGIAEKAEFSPRAHLLALLEDADNIDLLAVAYTKRDDDEICVSYTWSVDGKAERRGLEVIGLLAMVKDQILRDSRNEP